jgi:signal transduction histidine kinase
VSYRWIKWIAVVVPAVVLGLWEGVRHRLLEPLMPPGIGNWVSACIVMLGAYAFVQELVQRIERAARDAAGAWKENAVMRERQHIAREMHDSVAQALFYLNVQLADLDRMIDTEPAAVLHEQLAVVRENLGSTHQRVRQVISDLRQAEEEERFGDALQRIVREFNVRSPIHARLDATGQDRLGAGARVHLLAIVQEALVNVDKHSQATEVRIFARFKPTGFTLTVADNGRGFDPGGVSPESHGLTIMEERANLMGAEFAVQTAPGRGTRPTVRG